MRLPFRENANGRTGSECFRGFRQALETAADLRGIIHRPVDRDHADPTQQPAKKQPAKKRSIGQETDPPPGRQAHQHGINQRVRVVRHQQQWPRRREIVFADDPDGRIIKPHDQPAAFNQGVGGMLRE